MKKEEGKMWFLKNLNIYSSVCGSSDTLDGSRRINSQLHLIPSRNYTKRSGILHGDSREPGLPEVAQVAQVAQGPEGPELMKRMNVAWSVPIMTKMRRHLSSDPPPSFAYDLHISIKRSSTFQQLRETKLQKRKIGYLMN